MVVNSAVALQSLIPPIPIVRYMSTYVEEPMENILILGVYALDEHLLRETLQYCCMYEPEASDSKELSEGF